MANNDIACVILCGGRGLRMGSATQHKVCFPIAGVPAINRTLAMLTAHGVKRFVIVVGALAGDVVATVGQKFPEALFAYQHEQLGTGHAAQIGVQALRRLGHTGPVLITMGDKLIQPQGLARLKDEFARTNADLAFLTAPKHTARSRGRVLPDEDGRVLAIIEARDINRARALGHFARLARNRSRPIESAGLVEIGLNYIRSEPRLATALGPLWNVLQQHRRIEPATLARHLGANPGTIEINGRRFTGEQVEKLSTTVNTAVYLFRAVPLYEMIDRLTADNAQGEYYITELPALLSAPSGPGGQPRHKLHQVRLADPSEVQDFNSPDELLAIEDWVRTHGKTRRRQVRARRYDRRSFKPAERWLALLEAFAPSVRRRLTAIYGRDEAVIDDRRKAMLRVLRLFARRYGADRVCCLVRAPGHLNLMGRHVDHRGGSVNVMAIDREVIVAAAPRDDDVVRLINIEPKRFGRKSFRIGDLVEALAWDDWLSYVNSAGVRELIRTNPDDWSNYVKAAVMRLQQRYTDVRMLGMDCAVGGNIPTGAGLSSSSALVVAAAEAAVAINRLDVSPVQLADLCGEGEWFTGIRAGQSEHAAIRLGRRGSIAHVRFFPFEVARTVVLPEQAAIVVANSHRAAARDAHQRAALRFATYDLAMMVLRHRFPQYAHLLEHIRDINPERLGVPLSQIYRMLLAVPERITRSELASALGKAYRGELDECFGTHAEPAGYDLRNVIVYGAAECARSRMAPDLLEAGDLATFGLLMTLSHAADRVDPSSPPTMPSGMARAPDAVGSAGVTDRESRATDLRHDGRLGSAGGSAARLLSEPTDPYLQARIADLASESPDRVTLGQLHMLPGRCPCSTRRIDRMVNIACGVEGVYGAQLAGGGLGGCVMALAERDAIGRLRRALRQGYYQPNSLACSVDVYSPVEGADLLRL